MKCTRCRRLLKKGYYYNGSPYGPECINIIAGRKVKLSRLTQIKITRAEESDDTQLNLFK